MLKRYVLYLATVSATLLAFAATAQDFPNRPVRIVVPWPPSGNVDITARTVAPALADALGVQVIVDNRPGAGGTTGTAAVAKSPPDGYTLLLGSSGTVTNAPAVYKNITYDPVKDLTAIGPIQSVPMVLTAAPKTPVTNFKEFLAYAQSRPGQVSIASAGNGSSNHLAIELLMRQTGMKLIHIPYKGSGPAIADLLGSQVEAMVDQMTASIGHIRENRMKALAVTSKLRSPMLPNVPTLNESGLPGYEVNSWYGVFAPLAISKELVTKINADIVAILGGTDIKERLASLGAEPQPMKPDEFGHFVREDVAKWAKVVKESGAKVD